MNPEELNRRVAEARRVNDELRAHLDRRALVSPVHLGAHLDPYYQVRPHIEVIGRAFERVLAGEVKRLMILMPPQSGKSVTAGVWGPLWWMARRPRDKVALVSYGLSLAITRGKSVRRLIEANGDRYGLRLDRASKAANDWELESGGGMRSVGIGGGLTGRQSDLGIVDDPHKDRAEANSPARRLAVQQFWSGTFIPRLQPGSPAIVIMTPWHPDDLRGWLLAREGTVEEGGKWTVLYLPAIAMAPRQAAMGTYTLIDALGRSPGEPLSHPRIPDGDTEALHAHWASKREDVSAADWASLYQGDPAPTEGALLTYAQMERVRVLNPTATPVKSAVAVDPSGGGRDLAGIVGGWLGDDQALYLTHDVSGVMSSDEWSRRACQLAVEIDADRIVVEANYGGDMTRLVVRTAWDSLRREHDEQFPGQENPYDRVPPLIMLVNAKKGKVLRADPVAQQVINNRYHFVGRFPELEHEWATFQPLSSWSPGRIDASVHLALNLLKMPGVGDLISSAVEISKSQVQPVGWTAVPKQGYGGR